MAVISYQGWSVEMGGEAIANTARHGMARGGAEGGSESWAKRGLSRRGGTEWHDMAVPYHACYGVHASQALGAVMAPRVWDVCMSKMYALSVHFSAPFCLSLYFTVSPSLSLHPTTPSLILVHYSIEFQPPALSNRFAN